MKTQLRRALELFFPLLDSSGVSVSERQTIPRKPDFLRRLKADPGEAWKLRNDPAM